MGDLDSILSVWRAIWPVILLMFGWGIRIELCRHLTKKTTIHNSEAIDKMEKRIDKIQEKANEQAVQLGRIQQSLNDVKATLDRIDQNLLRFSK